jgi:hypothetical protein
MGVITFPSNDTLLVQGQLIAAAVSLPASCVGDTQFQSGVAYALSASKQEHEYTIRYGQKTGTDVAAETQCLYIVQGASGDVQRVAAYITTVATGDHAVTVDILKSHAGGAFTTILSTPIVLDATHTGVQAGTITVAPYLADDVFEVVVTDTGSSGGQGQGLVVAMHVTEDA